CRCDARRIRARTPRHARGSVGRPAARIVAQKGIREANVAAARKRSALAQATAKEMERATVAAVRLPAGAAGRLSDRDLRVGHFKRAEVGHFSQPAWHHRAPLAPAGGGLPPIGKLSEAAEAAFVQAESTCTRLAAVPSQRRAAA